MMLPINRYRVLTQFKDTVRLSNLPSSAMITGDMVNLYETLAQEIIDGTEPGSLYGELLKTDIQVIAVEYFDEGNCLTFVSLTDDINYYRMYLRNDSAPEEYKNDSYAIAQITKQTSKVVLSISFGATDVDKLIRLRQMVAHHYNKYIKD